MRLRITYGLLGAALGVLAGSVLALLVMLALIATSALYLVGNVPVPRAFHTVIVIVTSMLLTGGLFAGAVLGALHGKRKERRSKSLREEETKAHLFLLWTLFVLLGAVLLVLLRL